MKLIDQKIENYCISKSDIPSKDCEVIENYTKNNVHGAHMLIGKMEASVMGFLIRSIDAKRVLEFGTFTGYSALSFAENLPQDGEVLTVDINEKTVKIAQDFWNKSKHGKKITAIISDGLKVAESIEGRFDFIFIDADKKNLKTYLNLLLPKLSYKGIIVIDNVLWGGRVIEEISEKDEHRNTKFIQDLNNFISMNNDIYGTLLPIRDGMFLIKKK